MLNRAAWDEELNTHGLSKKILVFGGTVVFYSFGWSICGLQLDWRFCVSFKINIEKPVSWIFMMQTFFFSESLILLRLTLTLSTFYWNVNCFVWLWILLSLTELTNNQITIRLNSLPSSEINFLSFLDQNYV